MDATRHSLLVRADFILGGSGDRLAFARWRRPLATALPRLVGVADRCPEAERVRLREEGWFSGWLRIPVGRRPKRKRLRKLKAKLRARLEAGLLPVGGRVLKLGVRRCRPTIAAFEQVPTARAA